jgi:PIN domain
MTLLLNKLFGKCAPSGDDCRSGYQHRCQRDLLAREAGTLPRSVGAREIRPRHQPSDPHGIRRSHCPPCRRYPTKQPTDWLSAIKHAGHLYLPAPRPASTADPDDEMFIECAAEAQADYVVTGDKGHLLALKQAAGIPIVAVSDFLRLIGVPENPT